MHGMTFPFEVLGTVQVTQTCLTAGVGMNEPSKALGIKRGLAVMCTKTTNWPWLLLKLDVSTRTRPNPILINSVISQAISTILTICPIFQTVINIPQTTILSPSNIIGSYHIKMKYQCMMNWMGCILESLYLMDPSRLGCTTHIIRHFWHVMKVQ